MLDARYTVAPSSPDLPQYLLFSERKDSASDSWHAVPMASKEPGFAVDVLTALFTFCC